MADAVTQEQWVIRRGQYLVHANPLGVQWTDELVDAAKFPSEDAARQWCRGWSGVTYERLDAKPDSDPLLCVSMSKSLWEALLSVEPFAKKTYTDEGISILNAFQQVHQQTGIEARS